MNQAGEEFDFDVIARGAFIDDLRCGGVYPESLFRVETITLRLNHIALGDYVDSIVSNVRECYADGAEGDTEFKLHKGEYQRRRDVWEKTIIDRLDLETGEEAGVFVKQVQSEIFTVVYIAKITGKKPRRRNKWKTLKISGAK
jgi:hypothetical protein